MSDPLTRAEIEDVLSSIRRLVSEEGRSAAPPRPPGPAAAAAGRLVLTPAQRVGDAAPSAPAADRDATIRDAARRLADARVAAVAAAQVTGPAVADPSAARGASALEETIAELEAAVAAAGDDWEPDGSERAAAPASAAAAPAVATAAARAGNVHSLAVLRRPPADLAPAPEIPDGLDEASLRDLVAEIVREELQGALGERITRNVRKLVRAEVARALASRQFD